MRNKHILHDCAAFVWIGYSTLLFECRPYSNDGAPMNGASLRGNLSLYQGTMLRRGMHEA
ncbi:MAG TPA: hypothetical protein VL461_08315 [Dictyobacter sp.]|nr:hypothetical protein [Dictyobacter sp.]